MMSACPIKLAALHQPSTRMQPATSTRPLCHAPHTAACPRPSPLCPPLPPSKRKGRPSAKDLPEELTKKLGDANMMYTTGR